MKIRYLFLIASLGLLVTCGNVVPIAGDGGNEDGDATSRDVCDSPIALEDFAGCFYRALCEQEVRCNPFYKDREECETIFLSNGGFSRRLEFFESAVAAGKTTFDGEAAATCFSQFETATCFSDGPDSVECDSIFIGTVAAGGSCIDDIECSVLGSYCTGDSCDGSVQCCTETCFSPVEIGESCAVAPCQPGDQCVFDENNVQVCQSGAPGTDCISNSDCDLEAFCSDQSNECEADRPVASACSESSQCQGNLRCVGATCTPVDSVGAACNASCIGGLGCFDGQCSEVPGLGELCPNSRCNSLTLVCAGAMGSETCVSKQGVNEVCGPTLPCLPGLLCESDLPNPPASPECVELRADGETCSDEDHCRSGRCDPASGECAPAIDCYAE